MLHVPFRVQKKRPHAGQSVVFVQALDERRQPAGAEQGVVVQKQQ